MLWGLGVLSFVVALVSVRLLAGRFAALALDQPNARSLHEQPVPRTGGIAVLAGISVSFAFLPSDYWLALVLGLLVGAVSLIDDLRGMPTGVRLAAHLAAAAVLVAQTLGPGNLLGIVLLALAVAWVTNLYNFMDGSDGLAGGMALIGFGAYALAALLAGNPSLAMLCAAISAATAAFLTHNFPPARIFLGDVGSIPLGFFAGGLGVLGWQEGLWPLWFPVLVFGPFVGDATITLVRRLLRGERVWQAHREHYYQRLVRMGFGHRGTALFEYAVMVACAAAALFGRTQSPVIQAVAFLGAATGLAAIALWVDLRWLRFSREAA